MPLQYLKVKGRRSDHGPAFRCGDLHNFVVCRKFPKSGTWLCGMPCGGCGLMGSNLTDLVPQITTHQKVCMAAHATANSMSIQHNQERVCSPNPRPFLPKNMCGSTLGCERFAKNNERQCNWRSTATRSFSAYYATVTNLEKSRLGVA